ncbi:MAG: glycoside hydrolase family 2 TIM barrel-domain containing protein [Rariglobus sp.]
MKYLRSRIILSDRLSRLARLLVVAVTASVLSFSSALAAPVKTLLVKSGSGWQLTRDGKPYFIKGGGGGGPKDVLAESGGNSFRTWGVGKDTQSELDEAHKLGLTVTVGIWLGDDPNGIRRGIEENRKNVLKFKDHPALLAWSIGNEMESHGKNNPELWKAIEELAAMVKKTDPNHPTMTVIAELGDKTLGYIKEYCPSIDIVGVNTYGGGPSVGDRYKKANIGKPYVITEYGPPGTWEIGRNSFGAAEELTSTEKAKSYRTIYEKSVLGHPGLCLGSYAFTWGFKREATATWYGLFLPDNTKLAAVDTLTELWSGRPPKYRCPTISKITLSTPDQPNGGDTLKASVTVSDPQNAKVEIKWALVKEMSHYNLTGTGAAATSDYSAGIVRNGQPSVEIKLPTEPGVYRVFCYLSNPYKAGAVASAPIKIKKK